MIGSIDQATLTPTGGRRFASRFVKDRLAAAGALFILLLVALAILAPEVSRYSPTANFPLVNAGIGGVISLSLIAAKFLR